MKKAIAVLFFLALAGVVGWQVLERASNRPDGPSGRKGPGSVAVEVAPVQQKTIRHMREFTGTLLARSRFIVSPKVGGRLKKLCLDIGDEVERNQLIAVIDDTEYRLNVERAVAELEVAKANVEEALSGLDAAQREFERVRALQKKKIASASELDSAKAQYQAKSAKHKVTLAQVNQREAALKSAQVRLADTEIHAIWEGEGNGIRFVGERFVDVGATLVPNAPILSILDILTLKAVIYISEREVPLVRPGQETTVTTDAFPDKVFHGSIVRVSPLLRESSRKARAEIGLSNPDLLLKPGMFIRAAIEFARRERATVVPLTAVTKRGERRGVFVADREALKARFVPVSLGIVDGPFAEVVDPPLAGWVVTLGQHLLRDGSGITLPEERAGKDAGHGKGQGLKGGRR